MTERLRDLALDALMEIEGSLYGDMTDLTVVRKLADALDTANALPERGNWNLYLHRPHFNAFQSWARHIEPEKHFLRAPRNVQAFVAGQAQKFRAFDAADDGAASEQLLNSCEELHLAILRDSHRRNLDILKSRRYPGRRRLACG